MGALTKAEMADQLFEELGLNKREAKEIVEAFFEEIRLSLESNEQVKISGFGNFDLRDLEPSVENEVRFEKNMNPDSPVYIRRSDGMVFYS